MELEIKLKGPFIHKFQTNEHKYIYDVNTSQIVQVDDIVFDIIDEYGVLDEETLQIKYSSKWGKTAIRDRLSEIGRVRLSQGLFSNSRPVRRAPALNPETLKRKITTELQQITLNVTENCNLRCSYCIYSGDHPGYRTHSNKIMSWNVASRAIDYLLQHCQNQKEYIALGFYGGEPLLEFELIKKCVSKFKNATKHLDRAFLTITTNGTILNQEILHFLIDNQIMILVSLDGPQFVHDAHRTYKLSEKGTFTKVMNTIRRIQEYDAEYAKKFLRLAITLVPPIDYIQLDDFFSSLGLHVRASYVQLYGTPNFPHIDPHYSELHGAKEMGKKFLQASIDNVFNKDEDQRPYFFLKALFEQAIERIHLRDISNGLMEEYSTGGLCIPGADKIFVSADGTFYVCERVEGNKNMRIGDIERGVNINRIFQMISRFNAMGNNDCRNCWLLRICHMCFTHVVNNHRYDEEKRHYNCDVIRRSYHDTLSLYCSIMERNPNAFDYLKKEWNIL